MPTLLREMDRRLPKLRKGVQAPRAMSPATTFQNRSGDVGDEVTTFTASDRRRAILRWAIAEVIRHIPGLTEADAIAYIELDEAKVERWKNDLYVVGLRRGYDTDLVWLTIRRCDGKAIYRDWRDFQAIKNQLIGEECEAIELYPAESRLLDAANQYHLYGIADPSFRFPVGCKH
jgi:hypothetical protein